MPTLYELLGRRSHVSLLYVHNGATLYTTVAPSSLVDIVGRLISGTMEGDDPENSLSAGLDLNSVQKLTEAIDAQGVPDLQVVYFPGTDIFTHVAKDRLAGQVRYLESITDWHIKGIFNVQQCSRMPVAVCSYLIKAALNEAVEHKFLSRQRPL